MSLVKKNTITFILILVCTTLVTHAQYPIKTSVDTEAKAVGGKLDVDYIIQSQLLYPVNLFKKNIGEVVTLYFTVTEKGKIVDCVFKTAFREEFKTEALRLIRFIKFEPAVIANTKVASQTFITIEFSPQTYRKQTKARGFMIPKDVIKYDTSFVVYDRADVSAEYIKGEEALGQYVLETLEYPEIAVRQNLQGIVILNFIVEPNGTLSNIVALKEFNHFCTLEAIKVLRTTKWKAGKKDGKNIRYITNYPIVFNLNNKNKDNATSEQRQ